MCNILARWDDPRKRCYKLPQEAFLGVVTSNFEQRRHQRKEASPHEGEQKPPKIQYRKTTDRIKCNNLVAGIAMRF